MSSQQKVFTAFAEKLYPHGSAIFPELRDSFNVAWNFQEDKIKELKAHIVTINKDRERLDGEAELANKWVKHHQASAQYSFNKATELEDSLNNERTTKTALRLAYEELEAKLAYAQNMNQEFYESSKKLVAQIDDKDEKLVAAEIELNSIKDTPIYYKSSIMEDEINSLNEKLKVAVEALEYIKNTVSEPGTFYTADSALKKISEGDL